MAIQPYIGDAAVKQYLGEHIIPAYDDAHHALDADYPIWASRAIYDHAVGNLSWERSCAKHLRECREALGLPGPPVPPMTILPRLVIQGQFFGLENGERFTAIECSDFNLLCRYQSGQDITPILRQRRDAGFNLLRVWTLYSIPNIGHYIDIDYVCIPGFLALCASYGLYVEFTAYTSTEHRDHWNNLCAACLDSPTKPLVELVNEGTLAVNEIDMSRYGKPAGLLCSHGSGGSEGVPPWEPWDYITFHTNGSSEEQRKVGHNAMFDCADPFDVPALTNETSRFPDVGMWRGADTGRVKALAFDSAAGASLLCSGSCFHSVAGKTSVLWDDATLAAAQAWAQGARSVNVACQTGDYRRRDDLLTPDLLRVYQRGMTGCLVAIRA